MAILHDFEFEKPKNIEETLQLLSKYKEKAKILAGGTDLIVHLKEGFVAPDCVIDVKDVSALKELKITNNNIFIGAGVTFTELIELKEIEEKLPILYDASQKVASVGIRNRATLVGNICSAVPSLDSAPALLVYDAEILVVSLEGERKISIHDWFTGVKKTILKPDELVLGININIVKHTGVYEKLGRYRGEDLAQAGIGIFVGDNDLRFAYCAVGPIPQRMRKLEDFLKGKEITDDVIDEAAEIIPTEISPITDIRSSKEYRTHMMKVMFKRGLKKSLKLQQGGKS